MAKKVNMFAAKKALSERVADFMTKTVWGGVLKTRLKAEESALAVKIENVENLRGSIMDKDGAVDTMIQEYTAELAEVQKKYEAQIEAEAKFVFTAEDTEFFAEYKKGNIEKAVLDWAAAYDLDLKGTDFLTEVVKAVDGRKAASFKKIVKSEGKEFTTNRTKNDVLKTLYGTFADKMIAAGTLKAAQIPADVREIVLAKK